IRGKLVTGVQTCALPISVIFAPSARASSSAYASARSDVSVKSVATRMFLIASMRRGRRNRHATARVCHEAIELCTGEHCDPEEEIGRACVGKEWRNRRAQ